MAKVFPGKLFVVREGEGTPDEFLCPSEDLEGINIQNDRIKVGIYKLEKTVTVKNSTEIIY